MAFLARIIDSTAVLPTFFIAPNPNRMLLSTTENPHWLIFTSGGSTSIPIRFDSSIRVSTRSVRYISLVSEAARNSAG